MVAHSKKCIVFFIDSDAGEVWSYPMPSAPDSFRLAFGIGSGPKKWLLEGPARLPLIAQLLKASILALSI